MSLFRPRLPTKKSMLVGASLLATVALGTGAWLTLGLDSFAQDAAAKEDVDRPAKPKKKPAKPAEKPEAAAAPAQPAPTPAAPGAQAQQAPAQAAVLPVAPEVTGQLRQAGAGACAAQVDAMAAATMGGVAQFNTVSSWATAGGDKRVVGVSIGQKYPDGAAVPYGATSVMAAPNGQGSCDAMAVQVVPSPLPCAKLRETISTRGKQIGDLAGVPLMQDASGQTLLVPTAANTCVLVGLHAAYAK